MSDNTLNPMESKNIKDYLHLYLGCEVETTIKGNYIHPYGSVNIDVVDADSYENLVRHLKLKEDYQKDGFNDYDWVSLKLILRPLSDMTEEDYTAIYNSNLIDGHNDKHPTTTIREMKNFVALNMKEYEVTRLLLSRGFDLFGLIDAGLAIKKSH